MDVLVARSIKYYAFAPLRDGILEIYLSKKYNNLKLFFWIMNLVNNHVKLIEVYILIYETNK